MDVPMAYVPKLYRKMYKKALEGKASPRQAIKVFCYQCLGWEDVWTVRTCPARECPLWEYRPMVPKEPQNAK